MLKIYRRHRKSCAHRGEGRGYRRCRCPIWVDGFLAGQEIRKSLDLGDWERAQERIRDWEAAGLPAANKGEAISIDAAEKEFLADCESRKLKKSTVGRYRILFRELDAFAASEGFRFLKQLEIPALNKFRATWKGESGLTDLKKLERLRGFSNSLWPAGTSSRIPRPRSATRRFG